MKFHLFSHVSVCFIIEIICWKKSRTKSVIIWTYKIVMYIIWKISKIVFHRLTSEWMLTWKSRKIDVILDHHNISHLRIILIIKNILFPNLTVNILFRPPPAFVTISCSIPMSFITRTGIAVFHRGYPS